MAGQSRDELNRKARERMAAYRQTPEYQDWLQRSRELRRQLKAKYRRDAGAMPRDPEATAAKRARRDAARERRAVVAALHDAHVKRFRHVMRYRAQSARRYESNPEWHRARSAARKAALPDAYVLEQLRYSGFPAEAASAGVIELKREAIQFRRLSRQIRKEISNQPKEVSHESITQHS